MGIIEKKGVYRPELLPGGWGESLTAFVGERECSERNTTNYGRKGIYR